MSTTCECCENRTATVQTTYNRKKKFTIQLCSECRGGHEFYPGYPALDKPINTRLHNIPDYNTNRGTYYCWCCELYYYKHEGLNMKYEGSDWKEWMCTSCGLQQQVSYEDKTLVTPGTLKKLKEKM